MSVMSVVCVRVVCGICEHMSAGVRVCRCVCRGREVRERRERGREWYMKRECMIHSLLTSHSVY